MNDRLLEKKALLFRTENGLTGNEPVRLKSLLQKLNVITVFQPLTGNFSGMAIKTTFQGKDFRFMMVNSAQSLGKQHFTICHELYHLFVQEAFTSQFCETGLFNKKRDIEEYNADVFASYLLLPTEGLLENIPNEELNGRGVSISTILFLEHFYSSSRTALLYRLKKEKIISSEQYDRYCTGVKRSALENGYQTSLYEPGNEGVTIGDYGIRARHLYESDRISQSHYFSLLTDLGIDLTKLTEENGEEGERHID